MTNQFDQNKFQSYYDQLNITDKFSTIYMSNQYFEIIKELKDSKKLKTTHMGFVYAYMYLQSYMFRNTTYEYFVPTVKDIKEMLGYSPIQKSLDYIIKENGLLDTEKLTVSDNDFPIINEFSEELGLEFTTLSDLNSPVENYTERFRQDKGIRKSQGYKYPVLSFYESLDEYTELSLDNNGGTFFEVGFTTEIPFDVFAYCMSNSELGDTGFYLYAYLKHMNNFAEKKETDYSATYETIGKKTGLSEKTVQRYMEALRRYNLVSTSHNMPYFSQAFRKDERKASSHFVNDFNQFTTLHVNYDKLEVKKRKEHKAIVAEKIKKEESVHLIEFDLEELPF